MDERQTAVTGDDINESLDQISRIDRSYRQQNLLMSLESNSVLGTHDKAQRVSMAVSEGLLPNTFAASNVIQSPSMTAGGLMDDWDTEAF
jgi:hypothetical protein